MTPSELGDESRPGEWPGHGARGRGRCPSPIECSDCRRLPGISIGTRKCRETYGSSPPPNCRAAGAGCGRGRPGPQHDHAAVGERRRGHPGDHQPDVLDRAPLGPDPGADVLGPPPSRLVGGAGRDDQTPDLDHLEPAEAHLPHLVGVQLEPLQDDIPRPSATSRLRPPNAGDRRPAPRVPASPRWQRPSGEETLQPARRTRAGNRIRVPARRCDLRRPGRWPRGHLGADVAEARPRRKARRQMHKHGFREVDLPQHIPGMGIQPIELGVGGGGRYPVDAVPGPIG